VNLPGWYLRLEDWCWRHRIVATAPVILLLLLLARPTTASLACGFAIVLLGEAGRFWASGHIDKNNALATGGPYRFTRNPLYFSNLIIFLGYCVMAANPVAALAGLAAFTVIYRPCLHNEAAHMERLFGDDYRAWARRVPLFWPRPTAWPDEGRWRWPLVVRHREPKNALAIVGGCLLFAIIGCLRS